MLNFVNKLYIMLILYSFFLVFDAYSVGENEKDMLIETVSSLDSQIKKQNKILKQIDAFKADIVSKKEEIEAVARKLEEAQRKLPVDISDSKNIELLKQLAQQLKIKNGNVLPSGQVINDFYISKMYRFSGKGTYLQFMIFLEQISKEERIFNIRDIKLERITTSGKSRYEIINLDATIESYVYNKNYREDRGIERIEKELLENSKNKKTVKSKKSKRSKRRKK